MVLFFFVKKKKFGKLGSIGSRVPFLMCVDGEKHSAVERVGVAGGNSTPKSACMHSDSFLARPRTLQDTAAKHEGGCFAGPNPLSHVSATPISAPLQNDSAGAARSQVMSAGAFPAFAHT